MLRFHFANEVFESWPGTPDGDFLEGAARGENGHVSSRLHAAAENRKTADRAGGEMPGGGCGGRGSAHFSEIPAVQVRTKRAGARVEQQDGCEVRWEMSEPISLEHGDDLHAQRPDIFNEGWHDAHVILRRAYREDGPDRADDAAITESREGGFHRVDESGK
jgi:hypothetical protein